MKGRARLVALAGASAGVAAIVAHWSGAGSSVEAWSLGTAYSAFFLLSVSIALGPLKVMLRRANPAHSALRRDVGIAAGITALVHTALGLQVHMGGDLSRYFLLPPVKSAGSTVFVVSNYLGLISAVVLAGLVAISNNSSIRAFGLGLWKKAQRTAYVAVAAAIVHGLLYQILEGRPRLLIGMIAAISAVLAGFRIRAARIARGRLVEQQTGSPR